MLKTRATARNAWKTYDITTETWGDYSAPLGDIAGATGATHLSQVGPSRYLLTVATGIGATAPYKVYFHDSSASSVTAATSNAHAGYRYDSIDLGD